MNLEAAIDCDIHPTTGGVGPLLPYLDDYWHETVLARGIDSLDSISYPPYAPLTARPDWRNADGRAATDVGRLRSDILDPTGTAIAICNCLFGVQLVFDEYMAAAFARALNAWIAAEWLDRDPRLRASIVVPMQNVEAAVEEIERWAPDRRFVQVLVLAMGEVPLGRRSYWPIYETAERHKLPIGVHAGSSYRHPVTSIGWPSYYAEDYAAQAPAFQGQLASLITAGVFARFPGLRVVLIESGVTWLPAFMWRFAKFWRGLRTEVPWVDRSPPEIIREHVRLTVQPFDAPHDPAIVCRLIEQIGCDEILLYASDYPHWQFDGAPGLPPGLTDGQMRKICRDNALSTYPRLQEAADECRAS